MIYHVGTSGWNYNHWRGNFYPEDLRSKDWFEYFVTQFDTVEINNTFYRWPSEAVLHSWKMKAPQNFIYTIKAPRSFTHVRRLNQVAVESIPYLMKLTDILEPNLGVHLFQLPPSFHYKEENFQRLQTFVSALDKNKKHTFEFRHPGWWNEQVYDLFRQHNIAFCTVSGLGMPPDVIATADFAYLRFHGEDYGTNYSDAELKAYAAKIKKLKCSEVFAYFDNDVHAFAPQNALQLKEILTQ